jgi:hypothetical protein
VNLAVAKKRMEIPWTGIGAGLAVAVGGYFLLSRLRGSGRAGSQVRPELQIRPKHDVGDQRLESQTSTQSGPELRLKIVIDRGEQSVDAEGSSKNQ